MRAGAERVIVGRTKVVYSSELDRALDRAAHSSQSILIWADEPLERRTIAASIHERSLRRAKPFLCVPCDSTERFEAKVFGHEADALTGCPEARPGVLEMADGGTVFADDVELLDLVGQWRLSSASESGVIFRLGATTPLKVDVRYVFGTGTDLRPLVMDGHFREDLFRMVSLLAICVPPTRDLFLPQPLELEHRFVELSVPFPCPTCAATSRKFRQLRPGHLVCAACGQSFLKTV